MKKTVTILGLTLYTFVVMTSCGGKSTEECKDEVGAYKFGRDMHSWVVMRSAGLSLEDAIDEYSDGLGIYPPYEADNECVQRGFDDASSGKDSPY